MNKKQTLVKVVETMTEKPITITVQIKNVVPVKKISFFERLKGKKQAQPETERKFVLRPLTVGNIYRIAPKILELPDDIDGDNLFLETLNLVLNHFESLVYIVAVGLQNDKHEPLEELMQFIADEFESKDFHICYHYIRDQINVVDFMQSIILIKGANVLTVKEQNATSATTQD